MRDPFKPNSNKQLIREAQFGFSVIGLLVATLIYVAWFRLNGLDDMTPEHIRDSPVAMQVFPNSPNYDRETHTMRQPDRNAIPQIVSKTQAQNPRAPISTAQTPPLPTKSITTLASAPKRIMNDSNRTARSLQDAATAIEKTATRVATLANPPKTEKPFGLVSNPATSGKSDSGFKVLKKPKSDFLVDSSPEIKVSSAKEPTLPVALQPSKQTPKTVATSVEAPSSIASRFNAGSRFGPKPTVKTPSLSTLHDKQVNKPKTSNDFKPVATKPLLGILPPSSQLPVTRPLELPSIEVKTKEAEPSNVIAIESKPEPAKPFSAFDKPDKAIKPDSSVPRLPKLPEQSLNDLRSSEQTPQPLVKTVSFENATWQVKKGDSFWSIAQSNYGDGRFFRALYEKNRRSVPGFENLTEGVSLEIPTVEQLVKLYPDLCPSDAVRKNDPWRETPDGLMDKLTDDCDHNLDERLYETKSGDTLFGIARSKLGQASRYIELIELNEFRIDENVTHESELPSGIQLLLPKE